MSVIISDYIYVKKNTQTDKLDLCKQHKALRALGFACLNAAGCLLGGMKPEDFGFETVDLDDDEEERNVA